MQSPYAMSTMSQVCFVAAVGHVAEFEPEDKVLTSC